MEITLAISVVVLIAVTIQVFRITKKDYKKSLMDIVLGENDWYQYGDRKHSLKKGKTMIKDFETYKSTMKKVSSYQKYRDDAVIKMTELGLTPEMQSLALNPLDCFYKGMQEEAEAYEKHVNRKL